MLRVNITLGGLEYAEFSIRGENVGVDYSDFIYFDGAKDHIWMNYADTSGVQFIIDNPGTYDGTYGGRVNSVNYHTIITDGGVVYGVTTSGQVALSEAHLAVGTFYQMYYPVLQGTSEVIICGIKDS